MNSPIRPLAAPPLDAVAASAADPIFRRAGLVAVVAGTLGVAGQLLFFDVGLGINFPIAIALLLLGGWLVRDRGAPTARDMWLAPAALLYAGFVAVRADGAIVVLDVVASLGIAGAALASFGGRAVTSRTFSALGVLGLQVAGWVGGGALPALRAARRHAPSPSLATRRLRPALPVLRGILIAAPLVLIFVTLFANADAVFGSMVENLLETELDLGEVPGRLALAAVLGWLAGGAVALAASIPARGDAGSGDRVGGRRALGETEAVTIVVVVDLVFLAFVILQGTYLFGGRDTLAETGLTYAEYARRGFFELVAAAALAGGLVVALDRLTRRRVVLLVGASVALAAMTCVVLASAALRLRLYQEAYGWTELRLYVLAAIMLLGVGLVALVAALATDRVRWIGHAMVASGLVIGVGLNALGPARFVAEQNVARVVSPLLVPPHGSPGLDEGYALELGDEAIPALLTALPHLPEPRASWVRDELRIRLAQLRAEPGLNAWQAWNASRASARDALEAAAARGALDQTTR